MRSYFLDQILNVSEGAFDTLALEIFHYQARENKIYRQYIHYLGRNPVEITRIEQIPFLPIEFFKGHKVVTGDPAGEPVIFESSTTTGTIPSRHYLFDHDLYQEVSKRGFEKRYGTLQSYHILALLPSYLERGNSSLVRMAQMFMDEAKSPFSGFYMDDFQALNQTLNEIKHVADGRNVLLLGVTFALLDWADTIQGVTFLKEIPNLIIMETGGMKGRRKELIREQVHELLTRRLGVPEIHSEYGMTELISQAYSKGDGEFMCSGTMKVLLRETTDPLSVYSHGQTQNSGAINIIDLANIDSCCFIASQDLGKFGEKSGSFYVMGRMDNTEQRGCNLMALGD